MSTLTVAAIRNAQPGTKPKRLFDGGGLYLEIAPAGGKWWRLKYRFGGKEKRISFGVYPEVSLKDAREKLDAARKMLAQGIDPGEERKSTRDVESGSGSFEAVAREWHAKFTEAQWSEIHSKNILSRLEKNIFPWLGARPVGEITPPEIIKVFRMIESRGYLETLHRAMTNCGQVFRYAIASGRATVDPTYKMNEAFPKPIKHHFSAITDPTGVATLLRAIDEYHGTFVVKCALRLAPLVFLRPKELRLAEWSEFIFDEAVWLIPIIRMKRTRRDKEAKPKEVHIVPLSRQSLGILKELYQLTGGGRLVFPGLRGKDRAISDATLTNALRRMGYDRDEMHVHGFRAIAKTMMKQNLKLDDNWIERQLSHAVKGHLGGAYDRTTFEPERLMMMQIWADYLDKLKAGTEIIPIRAAG
ncbi:MAG: integrase arm-type DNA-binding domain-containing protein [Desulfobulbaceae bacterium]|nr:integrase arm-type DNA-binding domain-containing protein [Desulfobulbaceae bacterium]